MINNNNIINQEEKKDLKKTETTLEVNKENIDNLQNKDVKFGNNSIKEDTKATDNDISTDINLSLKSYKKAKGTLDVISLQSSSSDYLLDGERLDDLQLNGLLVIQKANGYCFTSDSVLLSSFAKISKNDTVVEFCAGSGVISILLNAKNPSLKKINAIEIQPRLADMATRSVKLNKLQHVIEVINTSVQESSKLFDNIDVIVCNPPYSKRGSSTKTSNQEIEIARAEELLTLQEIAKSASQLLKFRGRLYIMYPTERGAEAIAELKSFGLEPKTIQLVQSKISKAPHLILIEAIKGANSAVKWLNNLIIFDESGNYTAEAKRVYNLA